MRALLPRTLATILVLSGGGGVANVSAQAPTFPVPDQTAPMIRELVATQDFQRRVDEYITVHRMVEGPLPPLRPTRNMSEVRQTMQALALLIQTARPNAQQGDIITPEVGRMFKRRIGTCLSPEAWHLILAEIDEEAETAAAPAVTLRANMPWPETLPYSFMPPQLLLALPPLPPELQYRIIGRSLVLWDHHADLIVDFLPGAFASTT
jgi:hypothetical protein